MYILKLLTPNKVKVIFFRSGHILHSAVKLIIIQLPDIPQRVGEPLNQLSSPKRSADMIEHSKQAAFYCLRCLKSLKLKIPSFVAFPHSKTWKDGVIYLACDSDHRLSVSKNQKLDGNDVINRKGCLYISPTPKVNV